MSEVKEARKKMEVTSCRAEDLAGKDGGRRRRGGSGERRRVLRRESCMTLAQNSRCTTIGLRLCCSVYYTWTEIVEKGRAEELRDELR